MVILHLDSSSLPLKASLPTSQQVSSLVSKLLLPYQFSHPFTRTSENCTDVAPRAIVKVDQVSKFRNQKYSGTDDEFGAALRKSLLLETKPGSLSQDLEKIEFVAEIPKTKKAEKKKPHMSLIWRRKLGEINVRCQSSLPKTSLDASTERVEGG
jgi:hypothetical protein